MRYVEFENLNVKYDLVFHVERKNINFIRREVEFLILITTCFLIMLSSGLQNLLNEERGIIFGFKTLFQGFMAHKGSKY